MDIFTAWLIDIVFFSCRIVVCTVRQSYAYFFIAILDIKFTHIRKCMQQRASYHPRWGTVRQYYFLPVHEHVWHVEEC